MIKTQGGLPLYELSITNQYPFKNAHIAKIFNIDTSSIVNLPSTTLHTILEIYNQIQSSLLIQITSIQNVSANQYKVHYEYVDTPLPHYIRRFINQNIRIKIQKLCIELRDLANSFVVKGINVLEAISVKNIGVKMQETYRQSIAPQRKKNQILMPTFKVYIDLNKCQLISNKGSMARIVIETDKMIYNKINTQINEMIKKIEAEEQIINKKMLRNTQIHKYKENYHQLENNNIGKTAFLKKNTIEDKEEVHLDFSSNLKRRKRIKQPQSHKQIAKCQEKDEVQTQTFDTKSMKAIPTKSSCITEMPSQKLSAQVNDIIQRSRKTLKNFKQLIKKQQ